jgi:hypothetical protein
MEHVRAGVLLNISRNDNGLAGYLFGGPELLFFKTVGGAQRTRMVGADFGYGLDWRMDNGAHTGFEFAAGGVLEGPMPHLGGFLLWEGKK